MILSVPSAALVGTAQPIAAATPANISVIIFIMFFIVAPFLCLNVVLFSRFTSFYAAMNRIPKNNEPSVAVMLRKYERCSRFSVFAGGNGHISSVSRETVRFVSGIVKRMFHVKHSIQL